MQRRMTKHKQEILHLFHTAHVLSAQEIVAQLPHIDTSTIYRNLERFVADGELRLVVLGTSEAKYELAEHATHGHFVCDSCGEIKSVHMPDSLARSKPKGSQIAHIELTLHGRCAECVA